MSRGAAQPVPVECPAMRRTWLGVAVAVIAVACGSESESLVAPITSFVPDPDPSPTYAPLASVSSAPPSPKLGTLEWWEQVAPFGSYLHNSDLAPNRLDSVFWQLYASSFVASEWLAGGEPDPSNFGQFVRGLVFAELPERALSQLTGIDSLSTKSPGWVRPYFEPPTFY